MDVSVIVPTFNRRDLVKRTVQSLFTQCPASPQFEVIVVVDGSTDGTADALEAFRADHDLRVIEQDNRGPAAARNTGFHVAAGRLVLFVDDDMTCDPGLVAAHAASHQNRDTNVVFGSIFLTSDSPRTLASECFRREVGAMHLARQRNSSIQWSVTDTVFSNTSLSRKLLEQSEGFDEAFRMREDLELGIRLFRSGAHPIYASDAVAYQHYEKTATELVRDAEVFGRGDALLAQKHPEFSLPGHLRWFGNEPRWKQVLARILATWPGVSDMFLAPVCAICDALLEIPFFLNCGVRALQLRRKIHWYHAAFKSGWPPDNHKNGIGA